MILLSVDEVIELHGIIIARTGGEAGLRDMNLLASAVYSVTTGFGNEEAYPSIEEKAARLAFSLAKNHAFVDGNKRIAVTAMRATLRLNGVAISYTQKELIALGLGLAEGSLGYKETYSWILAHTK